MRDDFTILDAMTYSLGRFRWYRRWYRRWYGGHWERWIQDYTGGIVELWFPMRCSRDADGKERMYGRPTWSSRGHRRVRTGRCGGRNESEGRGRNDKVFELQAKAGVYRAASCRIQQRRAPAPPPPA